MPTSRRRASTESPSPADADRVAAARLHSAAIHLLRRLRREDDASGGGLTAPRLSALSVLVFGGPQTLGALAAAEQVRPPTMTRLVAALERLGLATREPDPADGRVVLVRATARARAVLEAGRARRVAVLAARLGALPAEERRALEAALPALERVASSG